MESNSKLQPKTSLHVTTRELIMGLALIAVIVAWCSTAQENQELRSEIEAFKPRLRIAAYEFARNGSLSDIVGNPVKDHPFITVLGEQPKANKGWLVAKWHEDRSKRSTSQSYPDRYGNTPCHWEQIETSQDFDVFFLIVGKSDRWGEYGVGVVVQGGIICMVLEYEGGQVYCSDDMLGFF